MWGFSSVTSGTQLNLKIFFNNISSSISVTVELDWVYACVYLPSSITPSLLFGLFMSKRLAWKHKNKKKVKCHHNKKCTKQSVMNFLKSSLDLLNMQWTQLFPKCFLPLCQTSLRAKLSMLKWVWSEWNWTWNTIMTQQAKRNSVGLSLEIMLEWSSPEKTVIPDWYLNENYTK